MTADQETLSTRLMARAVRGDRAAYAELLTLLASATARYVRARVGDVPWVDDVVQETLLSIHGARHTFDARRPFAPWFYAIASNRMIDAIRRERRIASRELTGLDTPDPASRPPGGASAGRREYDAESLRVAMRTLTPKQRTVVHALKVRGDSVRDVSSRLGMSETAVKVTAHRGYRALRRLLGAGPRGD